MDDHTNNDTPIPQIELWELASIQGDMLTLDQTARVLDVSDMTVRRWTETEGFPFIKIGGYIRVPRAALIRYLNNKAQGFVYIDPGPLEEPEGPPDDDL